MLLSKDITHTFLVNSLLSIKYRTMFYLSISYLLRRVQKIRTNLTNLFFCSVNL